ncbi:NADH-ubiquinone oxidoreductase complex I, 21 kDa subunit-domain-containing protein [Hysterangium stoloniferum]|nr:NADH-ubiquinone oxidoreductase complex I, 21 kDa subunit-domain-containing protein [Hysterangium stoloniferum]
MPTKQLNTPYPLIDQDPHFSRVVRYFRLSDYAALAGATAAFPGVMYLLGYPLCILPAVTTDFGTETERIDPTRVRGRPGLRVPLIYSTVLGFMGGFLLAYQRSTFRFWGWTENEREEARDLAELSALAEEGKPLYGISSQPEWVKQTAAGNSTFSQLKFGAAPMFNFVSHNHHGTDPAKYGVKSEIAGEKTEGV